MRRHTYVRALANLEMTMTTTDFSITAALVPDANRVDFAHALFGIDFPIRLEPTVFCMASLLAPRYTGGFWRFYTLSNCGFFMAPESEPFDVVSENGFEGQLSAEALGVTACLYAYSQLSFFNDRLAAVCAEHYHRLREFAIRHPEVRAILAACD